MPKFKKKKKLRKKVKREIIERVRERKRIELEQKEPIVPPPCVPAKPLPERGE